MDRVWLTNLSNKSSGLQVTQISPRGLLKYPSMAKQSTGHGVYLQDQKKKKRNPYFIRDTVNICIEVSELVFMGVQFLYLRRLIICFDQAHFFHAEDSTVTSEFPLSSAV